MDSISIDSEVRARARRAYELGRLRLGAVPVLVVGAMMGLSLLMGRDIWLSVVVSLTLGGLALFFSSRGGVYGSAVMPGLLAGTAPLALPIAARSWGHCCASGSCYSLCLLGCVSGGLAAGFALGKMAAKETRPYSFLASASLLTAGAGLLGCAMAGAAGMTGMALAIAASSLPVVALAPRVAVNG